MTVDLDSCNTSDDRFVTSNTVQSENLIGPRITNWKLRRRIIWKLSSKFKNPQSLCSLLSLVILLSGSFPLVHGSGTSSKVHLTKRAAILNSQSEARTLLVPVVTSRNAAAIQRLRLLQNRNVPDHETGVADNSLEQSELSQRITFPDEESARVRFPSEGSNQGQRGQRNLELEEGRKASPDVQDIIDGIVKLLGGKVHNQNNNVKSINNNNRNGQQQYFIGSNSQQKQPNLPNLQHQQNLQNSQNFQNSQNLQHPQNSQTSHNSQTSQNLQNPQNFQAQPQIPLNQPYNLFNPTKPIFFTTAKPARINNRGPPIPIPTEQKPLFEAIPLEALHAQAKNVTIGPPFSLTQVKGQEPPYQLGVPIPQQLVPTHQQQEAEPVGPKPFKEIHYQRPHTEYIPNLPEPQKPLLVPVTPTREIVTSNPGGQFSTPGGQVQSHGPNPIQAQKQTDSIEDDEKDTSMEDDERDAEQLLNGSMNGLWIPFGSTETANLAPNPINLEPTITDETQLPSFVQDQNQVTMSSSTGQVTSQLSSSAGSTQSSSQSVPSIIPTKASTMTVSQTSSSSTKVTDLNPGSPVVKGPVFNSNRKNIGIGTSTSLGNLPTPALRPGIVLPDEVPKRGHGHGHHGANNGAGAGTQSGYGSVEVVSADDVNGVEKHGEVFDVTVTAQQKYGNQATVQPFVIPLDISDEIITAPNGNQQFVSIDGKRTYFNLHSSTTATPTITQTTIAPPTAPPVKSHPGIVGPPSHPFAPPATGSTTKSRPATTSSSSSANKSIGTSLKITSTDESLPASSKPPPSIIRRPNTRRPLAPPVRIDTCIVGDDSTCNVEQFESCRTENGVSSCMCRPGYARKRHRETCKAIVALVLSIRLDKLGEKKLLYNPDYFNPNSEIYQNLEWETIHGLDSIFGDNGSGTGNAGGYIGSKLDAIGFDGRHAVVNSTVLLQEVPNVATNQVKRDVQRQLFDSITRHHNGLGKSQLSVEGPISAINAIADMNECESAELHDCDARAKCVNTYGSFECRCNPGYGDKYEKDKRRSGRKCESCNAKVHCNGRGECLIENGQNICRCAGNYYGSQCDIDGEVLAVAIGASVSAIVIIGLTLACLCMWSRRWKREEQKAALMSRTLFGGMASQAMSYLGKNSMTPYQQHMTLDERLRWAQVDPSLPSGNIYVSEPLSFGGGQMETSSQMMTSSARRSAETCDTTLDDLYEDNRHHMPSNVKRPKSRSSQLHYCDLEGEPQSEIYAARGPPFLPAFPAQFCVPTSPMNPYPHSRGFYS